MARTKDRTARQEAAASARAERARTKRRSTLIKWGLAIAAILLIGGWMAFSTIREGELLRAVKSTTYAGGQHADGPISYRESPPMGGTHNVIWQNCGVYDVPVHNEHGVHSMEHGAVWITYRPGLPDADLAALKKNAAGDYLLLSPYPGLAAPIVATAWNHQLTVESASDPRLASFITKYRNNAETTPELGAPCTGGTSAPATADTLRPSGPSGTTSGTVR